MRSSGRWSTLVRRADHARGVETAIRDRTSHVGKSQVVTAGICTNGSERLIHPEVRRSAEHSLGLLDGYPAVERVLELFGDQRWSASMFWNELANGHHYVVAQDGDGTVLGYAGLAMTPPEESWEASFLFAKTPPSYRRHLSSG